MKQVPDYALVTTWIPAVVTLVTTVALAALYHIPVATHGYRSSFVVCVAATTWAVLHTLPGKMLGEAVMGFSVWVSWLAYDRIYSHDHEAIITEALLPTRSNLVDVVYIGGAVLALVPGVYGDPRKLRVVVMAITLAAALWPTHWASASCMHYSVCLTKTAVYVGTYTLLDLLEPGFQPQGPLPSLMLKVAASVWVLLVHPFWVPCAVIEAVWVIWKASAAVRATASGSTRHR